MGGLRARRRPLTAPRLLRAAAEADTARPVVHFRPPAGWMNDPNGAIHHDGWYHLFYQHNPGGDAWGDIHWGHARSRDLVRWEHLPIALAPREDLDEAHCFSGTAIRDAEGRPTLFYTSVSEPLYAPPNRQRAVRCDDELSEFTRLEPPVLEHGSHGGPELSPDWRDPFVFRAGDRAFLVLGATLADGSGRPVVPLWEARDASLRRWDYRGILHERSPEETDFIECPNLFPLAADDPDDDRWVLLYTAHEPVTRLVGRFDPEAGTFTPERDPDADGAVGLAEGPRETRTERAPPHLDPSLDFYGTQTVAHAPVEGTVLVGWVRGWSAGRGWNGVLSLPRLITPDPEGRAPLLQRPWPGLEALRGEPAARWAEPVRIGEGAREVEGLREGAFELRAAVRPPDPGGAAGLRLRHPDGRSLVTVRLERGGGDGAHASSGASADTSGGLVAAVRVHRCGAAGGEGPASPEENPAGPSYVSSRQPDELRMPLPASGRAADDAVDLHLFWDRSLLEVFLDGGRAVCTRVVEAAGGEPPRVELFAAGGAATVERLEAWPLRTIW